MANVRVATEDDRQAVVDVITLAFSTDPMARWAFPDPVRYLTAMPKMIGAFGGPAFAHGTAHLTEDGSAAAMWLPPGIDPDFEQLAALTEQYSPAHQMDDMNRVFERMDSFHPSEPCWYLPLIGVDPTQQGRGHGSALLRYAVAHCDQDGVVAYLESSNPRNIPLYERHGFKALGKIQSGASPTVVPMLRRPMGA